MTYIATMRQARTYARVGRVSLAEGWRMARQAAAVRRAIALGKSVPTVLVAAVNPAQVEGSEGL